MKAGDQVMWAATNGNVRFGKILEWVPETGRWFTEIFPSDTGELGFCTWFKPESLIKQGS